MNNKINPLLAAVVVAVVAMVAVAFIAINAAVTDRVKSESDQKAQEQRESVKRALMLYGN